jgi:hypothetical protein
MFDGIIQSQKRTSVRLEAVAKVEENNDADEGEYSCGQMQDMRGYHICGGSGVLCFRI